MTIATNPRAMVTGGGSGIGRAFCLALAKRGGRVLVVDVNTQGAEETAELVRANGGTAAVTTCDVANREAVFALPDVMKEKFGGADVIFNNAGVAVGGPVGEIPVADWEWLMGINVWGVVYGCLAFLPMFRAQAGGHILNVASAAGLIASPGLTPYSVSKSAVVALSEGLSVELANDGIQVSVLCPTFIKTNIHLAGRTHGKGSRDAGVKVMERAKKTPDEIAEITLRAMDKNKLFIVPHEDGLWAWRAARADPEGFYKRLLPPVWKKIHEATDRGETPTERGILGEIWSSLKKRK